MGRVNSYERKGQIDSGDVEIVNKESKLDIRAALAGLDPLAAMEVDPARMPTPAELSQEQFLAQELEVQISDSGSEDDNQYAEVTVNGLHRIIKRGESGLLPRSHVAVLADAKELRLKQTKIVNPDGSMGYEERMVSKLTYPFTVIHDPAGRRGAEWLRAKLQAAR
jgi:hypothetical protein